MSNDQSNCDLTDTHVWDDEKRDFIPIGSHERLWRHNVKMASFLRALADGHTLEPEKLIEVAKKALEAPA